LPASQGGADNDGRQVITGEPSEQSPDGQSASQPQPDQQDGDHQQPVLQTPSIGEAPAQPQPTPAAPTPDSSGGLY
jgi:hypothetical protein